MLLTFDSTGPPHATQAIFPLFGIRVHVRVGLSRCAQKWDGGSGLAPFTPFCLPRPLDFLRFRSHIQAYTWCGVYLLTICFEMCFGKHIVSAVKMQNMAGNSNPNQEQG